MISSMAGNKVSILYHKYKEARPIPFEEEEFISFLVFFPALLVAASDGVVDREEWRYCQKLAWGLVGSAQQEGKKKKIHHLTRIYRKEFVFLLQNLEEWEEEFLLALHDYLQSFPYAKKFISQTIYLFADASNGIYEEEQNTMEYLCMKLKLDEKDIRPFEELKEGRR